MFVFLLIPNQIVFVFFNLNMGDYLDHGCRFSATRFIHFRRESDPNTVDFVDVKLCSVFTGRESSQRALR